MTETDATERELTRYAEGELTVLLGKAINVVRGMPDRDQDLIAQAIITLVQDGGDDKIDPGDLQDVLEGLAEIERGEVATEAEVEAAFQSFRR